MVINKKRDKLENKSRRTIQKDKIKSYLSAVKTHPNAEEVYLEVKKEIPSITLATIYRNLNQMAERGEILRIEINKEYRYDAETGVHLHLVCRNCRQIDDFYHELVSCSCLDKIKDKQFQTKFLVVILYGLCQKCQKNKDKK